MIPETSFTSATLNNAEQESKIKFQVEQKKLVKGFVYHEKVWVEYFTGFLFMDSPLSKIRVTSQSFLTLSDIPECFPLTFKTDSQGLYTEIDDQKVFTLQKPGIYCLMPEQDMLYLKYLKDGEKTKYIFALRFHSRSYCNRFCEHLQLVVESRGQSDDIWSLKNLQFLNASMKENLVYVDLTFMSQDRADQFLLSFSQIDKGLYNNPEKSQNQDTEHLIQYFYTVKYIFSRANQKVITYFISKQDKFQILLRCLSYNPFGKYRFNYLKEFQAMTVVHSTLLNLNDSQFHESYNLITRIKYLKDVAICTFFELTTESTFSILTNEATGGILRSLVNEKNQVFLKLKNLSLSDEENFINIFCEIWEIFKGVMEDCDTVRLKQKFYHDWIQYGMFPATFQAISRIVNSDKIQSIHPRFWQKLLESMNPMLSFNWVESQKLILDHQNKTKDSKVDLMTSLITLLGKCDSNTKVIILDFVKAQIEESQNRKNITARYLSYVFKNFVRHSASCCSDNESMEKYIGFVNRIYFAEPIRTRHFMIESELLVSLKTYMNDKFVMIVILRLLNGFVDANDSEMFRYLLTIDIFDGLKEKYMQNQKLHNVINSLFLSIFKSALTLKCSEGKTFFQKVFLSKFKWEDKANGSVKDANSGGKIANSLLKSEMKSERLEPGELIVR